MMIHVPLLFSLLILLNACTTHPPSTKDLQCLTLNIYHEARGEGLMGMLAVGEITINRVNNKKWPNSICAVVYQDKQFSWTHDQLTDSMKEEEAKHLSQLVAKLILSGVKLNLTK
ncbi:cell wall hydrolase, partial [Endozoicomonas sp. SM1973]|nr:cell wall hydrolase [Spartinivicinus marinus]